MWTQRDLLSKSDPWYEVFLLTTTNLAIVPSIIWAIRHHYYVEAIVFFFSFVCSTFYHLCDTHAFCVPPFSYSALQFSDFFFSMGCLAVATVFLAGWPLGNVWKYTSIIFIFCVMAIGLRQNPMNVINYVVIFGLGAVVVFARIIHFTIIEYKVELDFRKREQQGEHQINEVNQEAEPFIPNSSSRRSCHPLLHPFPKDVEIPRFNFWLLMIGAIVVLLGTFFFIGDELIGYYWILHSCWHICCYGCTFFILLSSKYHNPPEEEQFVLFRNILITVLLFVILKYFDFGNPWIAFRSTRNKEQREVGEPVYSPSNIEMVRVQEGC